jgi:hypothetical protein
VRSANPQLTALQTKAILLSTTDDITTHNPSLDRNAYGTGWLRSDTAVRRALDSQANPVGSITSTSQPQRLSMPVVSGRQYQVAATWYRTNLGSRTWSDLNLRVLDGNLELARSWSPRNLYEQVRFVTTRTATLTIEVSAASLDAPRVDFAVSHGEVGSSYRRGVYTLFGQACAGSAGLPRLEANGLPEIGSGIAMLLRNGPPDRMTLLFIGSSNQQWGGLPLPFDLAGAGAPGCQLLAAGDMLWPLATNGSGYTSAVLSIPQDMSLALARFYNQFAILDPAANKLGVITTNGGEARIGGLQ